MDTRTIVMGVLFFLEIADSIGLCRRASGFQHFLGNLPSSARSAFRIVMGWGGQKYNDA